MSIKVMTMVFDRYPAGGNERLLALAMADHARDDGTRIWPSIGELARKTLQSESTVRRQIKLMLERGWLVLVRRASGRPGDTNEYCINAAWIGGAALPDLPALGVEETGVNLTPVSDEPGAPESVDKVIHTGVTAAQTGVKSDETGVIAVTPESSGTIKNRNTPLPPVGTGGCGEPSNPNPEDRQTDEAGKPEWRWRKSRSGIERHGIRLGLGRWDEAAFQQGRGEPFAEYERRVVQADQAARERRMAA